MKSAVKIIVKGRVQGVGYRWFTLNTAEKFGIKGFVKNLYNGNVEVFAEGEDADLLKFIEKLKEGPSFSNVTGIETDYKDFEGRFKEFKVKY